MQFSTRFYLSLACLLSAAFPSSSGARASQAASPIKSDEEVLFFPTVGSWDAARSGWKVPIHGWIYEPEEDSMTRGLAVQRLRSLLGLDPEQPSTELFEHRIRWFLVDNERGKKVTIRLGGEEFTLEESSADGHFFGTLTLTDEHVQKILVNRQLRYEAVTRPGDPRSFAGTVQLPEPTGISVISDIDDTIKVSQVRQRKELLQNIFFRPFEAVEGMAQKYSQWATSGAEFHYVSAAPWQIYEPVATFVQQSGFPPATFHMRRVRLKDTSGFTLLADPVAYKREQITELLESFRQRKFVLIGDSGEKDPEVYGAVARQYPEQVVRIFIRDVTQEAADSDRYRAALQGVPAEKWMLFRSGDQLDLPTIGIR